MNRDRLVVACGALLAGVVLVVLLNLILPYEGMWGPLMVDKRMGVSPLGEKVPKDNPFSVQAFMWVAFMLGMGEVMLRLRGGWQERRELGRGYLPESADVLLASKDLVPIYRKVRGEAEDLFLPRVLERIILQYQASKSVDRAGTFLNTSLDLFLHEIDLRYGILRFFVWLIPSLGFMGTVIGVVNGLNLAAQQYMENKGEINLAAVTDALGVAFYTTWLALLMAAVLVFLQHIAQENEERAANQSAKYCLDHLINKLYERN
jgi:biopolymer transport protein ExbB/TolQ